MLVTGSLLLATATAVAVTDPGDFVNGTAIDAGAVNGRFRALYTAVNNAETRIDALSDGPIASWAGNVTSVVAAEVGTFGVTTEYVDSANEVAADGTFEASRDGLYLVTASWTTAVVRDDCGYNVALYKNGVREGGAHVTLGNGSTSLGGGLSKLVRLDRDDKLTFGASASPAGCSYDFVEGWFDIAFLR